MADERWLQVKNVLVIRLDNLGDVLLATPAIRAIKETLPAARITLLASPIGAQVAELDPDIDDVFVYEAPWMDPWQRLPQDPEREQRMIDLLAARHFDGAVIFTSFHQSSLPAAYLSYLAGIPLRLGISIDGSGSLLTNRHRPPEQPIVHEVLRALDLVGTVGYYAGRDDLVLEVSDGLRAAVRKRLAADQIDRKKPLAVIHPGCSMPARTYPWDRYVTVANLLQRDRGAQVIFTGVASEVELVERIRARLDGPSLSWAGQSSFAELAGLIAEADVVITNNTGPQHVAAAVKTPVVVLFALTNPPEQWGPWRVPHRMLYHPVPCALCYARVCPLDHACLLKVAPEEVVAAAGELIAEGKAR